MDYLELLGNVSRPDIYLLIICYVIDIHTHMIYILELLLCHVQNNFVCIIPF